VRKNRGLVDDLLHMDANTPVTIGAEKLVLFYLLVIQNKLNSLFDFLYDHMDLQVTKPSFKIVNLRTQ
jgi:hypothetical protein